MKRNIHIYFISRIKKEESTLIECMRVLFEIDHPLKHYSGYGLTNLSLTLLLGIPVRILSPLRHNTHPFAILTIILAQGVVVVNGNFSLPEGKSRMTFFSRIGVIKTEKPFGPLF